MSRTERWNARDMSYPNWHRIALPETYQRTGHRLKTCDRDWTEFCFACGQPLAIIEELRDVGQDLGDKSFAVTRKLAAMASSPVSTLPAYLMAWWTDRSAEVQGEIDELNRRIRELERAYPISGFITKDIFPKLGQFTQRDPLETGRFLRAIHVAHWSQCGAAQRTLDIAGMNGLVESPLHIQGTIPLQEQSQ